MKSILTAIPSGDLLKPGSTKSMVSEEIFLIQKKRAIKSIVAAVPFRRPG